jgi:hypothetical protein
MADVLLEVPGFVGLLLHEGDEGYDEARSVFNGLIDRRPALIARCSSTADVVAAVIFARDHGLEITVYGGGHSVTGAAVCDGGVCIDLRGLKRLEVDPDARILRAGGGLTWGEVDAGTQAHGLAVPGGRVPTTGIGGLALGSGSAWTERKFGYTCDNLIEAEVVTAAGEVVTASATNNPDLFWALRGGGGNFGIVTTFTLRLHPVGPLIWGGMLLFPAERAAEVLRAYRDFMSTAADEVGGGLAFLTAPPEPFVPKPVHGQPVVGVICSYVGDPASGPLAFAPMLELGPAVALVEPMPYLALQQLIAPGNPKGMLNYWTADFYDDLPDEAITVLTSLATRPVSPLTQIVVIPGGGALSRVPEEATAFASRGAAFNIHYLSMWAGAENTDTNIGYTRTVSRAMKPWATGRAYLNFFGDEGRSRIEAALGPETYARLQRIKAIWDPQNLFHHNQNIPPAAVVPSPR